MNRLLDRLVSYFALDDRERPTYERYFCYHVIAGPGPLAGAGVATVTMLAVHDNGERCTSCQNFHTVKAGGPAAAMAAAVRYLDAYHEADHLQKVQSDTRALGPDPTSGAAPALQTTSRAPRAWHLPGKA